MGTTIYVSIYVIMIDFVIINLAATIYVYYLSVYQIEISFICFKCFSAYSPLASSIIESGGTDNSKFSTCGNEYVHPSVVIGFVSNLQGHKR